MLGKKDLRGRRAGPGLVASHGPSMRPFTTRYGPNILSPCRRRAGDRALAPARTFCSPILEQTRLGRTDYRAFYTHAYIYICSLLNTSLNRKKCTAIIYALGFIIVLPKGRVSLRIQIVRPLIDLFNYICLPIYIRVAIYNLAA